MKTLFSKWYNFRGNFLKPSILRKVAISSFLTTSLIYRYILDSKFLRNSVTCNNQLEEEKRLKDLE